MAHVSSTIPAEPVRILWTGGWDSTFRVLWLIRNTDVTLQPYYLALPDRPSRAIEQHVMDKLRAEILTRYPGSDERLLPTIVVQSADVPQDENIRKQWAELLKGGLIGNQYPALAEFAKLYGLSHLELGMIRDEDGYLGKLLAGACVCRQDAQKGPYHHLSPDLEENAPIRLFAYYDFPIMALSKLDIAAIAKEEGYFDLLCKTWFCYYPIDGKPCGICGICMSSLELGMDFRFSKKALRRYRVRASKAFPFPALRLGRNILRAICRRAPARWGRIFPGRVQKWWRVNIIW